MRLQNCELNILVRGRPIAQYEHPTQKDFYVEGRSGTEFEIEFVNRNSFKVEVVFSVDGLSVRDGQTAGPASRGYIVESHGRIVVPGWTLNNAQAAKFEFASEKGGSYVEQTTGSSANKGVIGALVYREAYVAPMPVYQPLMWNATPCVQPWFSTCTTNTITQSPIGGSESLTKSATPRRVSATASMMNMTASTTSSSITASDAVTQSLGTAFGDSTSFQTQQVAFSRGAMLTTLALYYDNVRGLRARGIEVVREKAVPSKPNPFPGMGCTPPQGWRG